MYKDKAILVELYVPNGRLILPNDALNNSLPKLGHYRSGRVAGSFLKLVIANPSSLPVSATSLIGRPLNSLLGPARLH